MEEMLIEVILYRISYMGEIYREIYRESPIREKEISMRYVI